MLIILVTQTCSKVINFLPLHHSVFQPDIVDYMMISLNINKAAKQVAILLHVQW